MSISIDKNVPFRIQDDILALRSVNTDIRTYYTIYVYNSRYHHQSRNLYRYRPYSLHFFHYSLDFSYVLTVALVLIFKFLTKIYLYFFFFFFIAVDDTDEVNMIFNPVVIC